MELLSTVCFMYISINLIRIIVFLSYLAKDLEAKTGANGGYYCRSSVKEGVSCFCYE